MGIKNDKDFQNAATSLPFRVARNNEYMDDAVLSRLETLNELAKKKQEIPYHTGGIWDYYKPTDVPELKARKSTYPSRNQTEVIIRRTTEQQSKQLKEMKTTRNLVGDTFESGFMDTSESFPSGTEVSALQYLKNHKGKGASGYDSVAVEGTVEFSSKNNQLILPPVERKIFPPVKKKNSDDEDGIERSKRCKTTSSEEMNFILPVSKNASKDNTQRFVEKMPHSSLMSTKVTPRNQTVSTVKKDTISKDQDKFYLGILEGSKVNRDDEVESGSKKIAKPEKLYEEEINTLKRVTSIFENAAKEPSKPHGNKMSLTKEAAELERICGLLKDLAAFSSRSLTKEKVDIDAKNLKKKVSSLQTEAVDFLLKKGIRVTESKEKLEPLMDTALSTETAAKEAQSSTNTNYATLTLSPKAAPLSPKPLQEEPLSESMTMNAPSSAMDVTSPSKTVVGTVPLGFEDNTYSLKANEAEPKKETQTMSVPKRNRSKYEIAPRFEKLKTKCLSPEDLNPPLKDNEVAQSRRGERPSPYQVTSHRTNFNEQKNNDAKLKQQPPPWRAAHQGSNVGPRVGPTNENVSQRHEELLPWRVRDEAAASGASYYRRQQERAKSRSPPLRSETPRKKVNDVGRSSVGNWRSRPEETTQTSNSIEKSNDLNAKREEKALPVGQARKSPDSCLVRASDAVSEIVTLKVFGEEKNVVDEVLVQRNVLLQVARRYPELIPPVDAQHLDLEYNADAVAVFLRFIFSSKFNLFSWEIAMEVFALAKKYKIQALQKECKDFFDKNSIKAKQVHDILFLARKFQITEVLETSPMFAEVQAVHVPDSEMLSSRKKSVCSVSCTSDVEPSELDIPLYYMEDKSLGSIKKCDIQNEIIFEGVSGTFCITGFQIKQEAGKSSSQKTLKLYFDVYEGKKRIFGGERDKSLTEDMIINFKHELIVESKKSVRLNVMIEDSCTRHCYCLKQEKIQESCDAGSFCATLSSDKRNESRKALFYIEKVFYTFKA